MVGTLFMLKLYNIASAIHIKFILHSCVEEKYKVSHLKILGKDGCGRVSRQTINFSTWVLQFKNQLHVLNKKISFFFIL